MRDDLDQPLVGPAAQAAFAALVQDQPPVTVLHDAHVDGLAAAAVWQRGAALAGWHTPLWCVPRPGEAAVVPADGMALGSVQVEDIEAIEEAESGADRAVPRRLWPTRAPDTTYWEKLGCASVWTWELWRSVADMDAWAWIAALGCVARAGRIPVPWLVRARAQHTGKFILAASRLLDAASRAPAYRPDLALQALSHYETPRALVQSADEGVRTLHALSAEVEAARDAVRHAEPYLAGRLAVVGVRSACSVEDELAATWAQRFPQHVVLVGNEGFAPGHVCYAAHTRSAMSARDFLRSVGWPPGCGARGVMPLRLWHPLLAQLRVPSGELPGLR